MPPAINVTEPFLTVRQVKPVSGSQAVNFAMSPSVSIVAPGSLQLQLSLGGAENSKST